MKKIFNSENLSYLVIISTPLYLIKLSPFQIPTNLLEILILLTILLWTIENKNSFYQKIKGFFSDNKKFSLLIILIVLGALISSFLNKNLLHALAIVRSWIILPILFSFILYQNVGSEYKKLDKVLTLLFYSSFLISFLALIYFLSGNLTYDSRLKAFYLSPNHLVMILSPGFLIGLWAIFLEKKINPKILLMTIFIFIIILMTRSYFGIVSVLSSFSILFIMFNRKNGKLLFAIATVFLALVSFLVLEKNSEKINSLINLSERTSLKSRMMIWESSFKIISDNWLWGVGPGNFQEKYLEYQKYFNPYLEWAVPQPHNLFLAFWLQTGLVGLFGFTYIIVNYFSKIKKALLKKESFQKNQLLILSSIILYFIIHGLIDTPYWKNDLSLIFWITFFMNLKNLQLQSK